VLISGEPLVLISFLWGSLFFIFSLIYSVLKRLKKAKGLKKAKKQKEVESRNCDKTRYIGKKKV
jgi:preprotein translocase subunit SecG